MSTGVVECAYSILIVGDSGVGKTSLLNRYVESVYESEFISTIGVDFRNKTIEYKGKNYNLKIWDTAGQERFRTITRNYYRGCQGLLLVFDLTVRKSFDGLKAWVKDIKSIVEDGEKVGIVVVGNKCDMPADARVVDPKEIDELCAGLGYSYCEVSAKTGDNVEFAFQSILKVCIEKWGVEKDESVSEGTVDIVKTTETPKKAKGGKDGGGCC